MIVLSNKNRGIAYKAEEGRCNKAEAEAEVIVKWNRQNCGNMQIVVVMVPQWREHHNCVTSLLIP